MGFFKEIFVKENKTGKLVNIIDLDKEHYESFLECTTKIKAAYIAALERRGNVPIVNNSVCYNGGFKNATRWHDCANEDCKTCECNYVRCFDKFEVELKEGDIVDVQKDGEHEIYKKEDGQLYFKPYGKEDRVSAYFSNDMIRVKR